MFHSSALPEVPETAIRRTHPSWLQRGGPDLPLLTVQGPRLRQM
jgi:hypothetical protein